MSFESDRDPNFQKSRKIADSRILVFRHFDFIEPSCDKIDP